MSGELVVQKKRFIAWLIDYPTREARRAAGVPETITEWAAVNDGNRVTCQRWKAEEDVQRQVAEGIRDQWLSSDDVAEIMDKMKAQAKDGHVPSARLALDVAGVLGKKTPEPPEPKYDRDSLSKLSDAEVKAMVARGDEREEDYEDEDDED